MRQPLPAVICWPKQRQGSAAAVIADAVLLSCTQQALFNPFLLHHTLEASTKRRMNLRSKGLSWAGATSYWPASDSGM